VKNGTFLKKRFFCKFLHIKALIVIFFSIYYQFSNCTMRVKSNKNGWVLRVPY